MTAKAIEDPCDFVMTLNHGSDIHDFILLYFYRPFSGGFA